MKVMLCTVPFGSITGTLQTNNLALPPGAIGLPWGFADKYMDGKKWL